MNVILRSTGLAVLAFVIYSVLTDGRPFWQSVLIGAPVFMVVYAAPPIGRRISHGRHERGDDGALDQAPPE